MANRNPNLTYISVDVESSGPIPGKYSLLSIGACVAPRPTETFYVELRPVNRRFVPEALGAIGRSMSDFRRDGVAPVSAMRSFQRWLASACGDHTPVFVGLNAPFDWSFVNWYFHHYLGVNPFGISALDIKSLYMGVTGCPWSHTRSSNIATWLGLRECHTHNALADAIEQAGLFEGILQRKTQSIRATRKVRKN